MLMYGEKQIGFVYQGDKVINKIIKNGELIHEKGFTREKTDTTPFNFKGLGSNIKKYSIKGNSVQNGTPTPDTPIDIKSVGELINILPTDESQWEQGTIADGNNASSTTRLRTKNFIPINDISCYGKLYGEGYTFLNIWMYDKNKTVLNQYYKIDSSITTVSEKKLTFHEDTKYIKVVVKNSDTSATITPDEIVNIKPQIEYGNSASGFNKYKIPVKMIGQNLFNKDDLFSNSDFSIDEEGFITLTYDNSVGTSTVFRNAFGKNLPLKSNTKYIIVVEIKEVEGNGQFYHSSILGNAGQFTWASSLKLTELSNNSIFTKVLSTRNDIDSKTLGLRTYAQFSAGESGSITFRISVLADTSVTTNNFIYKPYEEKTTNIYLNEPLRKVGDLADYIDFENKKVVRNFSKYSFTGNEKYNKSSHSNDEYFCGFTNDLNNILSFKYNGLGMSNMFESIGIYDTILNKECIGSTKQAHIRILASRLSENSVTGIQSYLKNLYDNGTPLYIIGQLETPTEESIEIPDIETFDGENNLTLDTTNSEMYIKYKSRV